MRVLVIYSGVQSCGYSGYQEGACQGLWGVYLVLSATLYASWTAMMKPRVGMVPQLRRYRETCMRKVR